MSHRDDLNKLSFTDDAIFNKYHIEEVVEKLKNAGFNDIDYTFDHGYYVKCK